MIGQRYVAVHPTHWGPGDAQMDSGLDELFGITCTITSRTPEVPRDRLMGSLFLKALTGPEVLARQIAAAVHQNYDLMNAANADVGGDDKFMQPLFWDGTMVPPRMETSAWVWSDTQGDANLFAALVLPVRFSNARRMQGYANME